MSASSSIVLLTLVAQVIVAQVHGEDLVVGNIVDAQHLMDKFVERLVDELFDRALTAWPLHNGDLDCTTLGKPGQLAISTGRYKTTVPCVPTPTSIAPIHSIYYGCQEHGSNNNVPELRNYRSNVAIRAEGGTTLPALPPELPPIQASASLKEVGDIAARVHLPFDTSYPGLHVVNADPPVLYIDDFLDAETCDMLKFLANETGALGPSNQWFDEKFGEFNYMRLTNKVMEVGGSPLAVAQRELRERTMDLMTGCNWAPPMLQKDGGQALPPPGKVCFEPMQVSRYDPGGQFRQHEDALTAEIVTKQRYQRLGTIIVYLSDVTEGGETAFPQLNVAVKPVKGRACLFFPAFADGTPDARTLHSSTDAGSTKWIAQQWLTGGVKLGNKKWEQTRFKKANAAKAKAKGFR